MQLLVHVARGIMLGLPFGRLGVVYNAQHLQDAARNALLARKGEDCVWYLVVPEDSVDRSAKGGGRAGEPRSCCGGGSDEEVVDGKAVLACDGAIVVRWVGAYEAVSGDVAREGPAGVVLSVS